MSAVVDWGRVDYPIAWERMRRLHAERASGRVADTLVLVEHPPVVTVGVEGDDGSAASAGVPVYRVERGGKSTYHGPGQLVGYPIVDLGPRGHDVRAFVHDVETVLIDTLREFDLVGRHVPSRRGVWIAGERKVASIGIAVERWVTFHGFALNVDVDLAAFGRIQPCGFDGRVMTSMARELGRPISLPEVRPVVRERWAEVLGRPGPARSIPVPPA